MVMHGNSFNWRDSTIVSEGLSLIAELAEKSEDQDWVLLSAGTTMRSVADHRGEKSLIIPVCKLLSIIGKAVGTESTLYPLQALKDWPGDREIVINAFRTLTFTVDLEDVATCKKLASIAHKAVAAGPDLDLQIAACGLLEKVFQQGDAPKNGVMPDCPAVVCRALAGSLENEELTKNALGALAQLATGEHEVHTRICTLASCGAFQLASLSLTAHGSNSSIANSASTLIQCLAGPAVVSEIEWLAALRQLLGTLSRPLSHGHPIGSNLCMAIYVLVSRAPFRIPPELLRAISSGVHKLIVHPLHESNLCSAALPLLCLCNSMSSGSLFLK